MLRMLAPSAVTPPSANTNAWTSSTVVMMTTAGHGPSRIAAAAPPAKCPDVPPATGKLSICSAKMSAASTAMSTSLPSDSRLRTSRTAYPTNPAEPTAVVTHVRRVEHAVGDVHDGPYSPRPAVVVTTPPCLTPFVPSSVSAIVAHLGGRAAYDEHLEAGVRVEVDVHRGDDLVVMGVLERVELVGEVGVRRGRTPS